MVSTTISSTSCIFSWDDQRREDEDGKMLGSVTHIESRDVYGKALGVDTDGTLRVKFFALSLGTIPVGILRAAFRAFHFLSCQWASEGYKLALKQWHEKRFECWKNKQMDSAPGSTNLALRVVACALYRFAATAIKLITLPIAIDLLEMAAIVGMITPLDGRRLYGSIEELWSIDLGDWISFYHHTVNFLAPCMQPSRVIDQINIYSDDPGYSPTTLRSRLRTIEIQLKAHERYFEPATYKNLIQLVKHLRSNAKEISRSDLEEAMGSFKLPSTIEEPLQKVYDAITHFDRIHTVLAQGKDPQSELQIIPDNLNTLSKNFEIHSNTVYL